MAIGEFATQFAPRVGESLFNTVKAIMLQSPLALAIALISLKKVLVLPIPSLLHDLHCLQKYQMSLQLITVRPLLCSPTAKKQVLPFRAVAFSTYCGRRWGLSSNGT